MVDEPRTQLVSGAESEPLPPQAVSQTDKPMSKIIFENVRRGRMISPSTVIRAS